MYRLLFVSFLVFVLAACSGQTKEELLAEGKLLAEQDNYRGSIVLYRSALEKDVNFLEARIALAEAYYKSGSYERAENEFLKSLYQSPDRVELRLDLVRIYVQQQAAEKALLELAAYHDVRPESADSLVLYGLAHGIAGDFAAAESFFEKAHSLEPDSVEAKTNLAKVYLQRGQLDRAEAYLLEAIALDNKEIQAYYLLADIAIRRNAIAAAVVIYQDLLKVDPAQLEALYRSGVFQLDLGDEEAAAAVVRQLKSRFSDRPEGTRLEGMLLYRQGKYSEARLVLQSSLRMQQHLLTFYFLGLSHYSLDELELALSQFHRVLDLSPDFDRARVMIAVVLLKQRRLDDAITEADRLTRRSPQNAYAFNVLGSALIARGDYDRGMDALAAATELDPALADAHTRRGMLHFARGEQGLGEADLLKAIEAAPEVMNSRLLLVTHYLRQRNFSAAIDLLQQGMIGEVSDALLNNYLAAAYFSQNRPEQALVALEKAKQINPEYLTPYYNVAAYYASTTRYDEAIAEYRQILELDGQQIRALLGLAAVYSILGHSAELDRVFVQLAATETEQGYAVAAEYAFRQQRFGEASTLVDRGLALAMDSVSLLEMKGGLLVRDNQHQEAQDHYQRLAEISPERGYGLMTQLHLFSGKREDAEELVAHLLRSDSSSDYPWLLSAGLLLQQGDMNAAKERLQQGLKQAEHPLRLSLRLGQLEEATGNLAVAERLYRQVLESAPRNADAHFSLGTVKERMGDKGAALESYRAAVSYDQRHVGALNNLAYLLVDNFGEAQQAMGHALSAYRLRPGDPRIMDTLGFVLYKNERFEDADRVLTVAHQLLPDVPVVALHLAMARLRTGAGADAKQLLQQVVAAGSGDEVAQAQKLLEQL